MTRLFWKRFIGTWLIAFLSLQLTRLVFYFNLRSYFEADFTEIVSAFLFGFEFDAVSIAYFLGPFFIALPFLNSGESDKLAKWYYLLMLGAMNFLNCTDAEFFKFTARRSTVDLFEFAFLSQDIFHIAPNLISHFWYLLAAFVLIALLISWMTFFVFKERSSVQHPKSYLSLIPIAIVLVIAARGGFHRIPLTIIDAGNTEQPHLNALSLSTPFTILKTIGKPALPRFEFNNEEILPYNPVRKEGNSALHGRLKGSNVVILIVESLSIEYMNSQNGLEKGFTPFLDSLSSRCMIFKHAFSNGHRSIEGIAAITASIPTFMYEPYSTTGYSGNAINSLANLLQNQGYYTTFIHGGNKNSMNFESFAEHAGYDLFYDRDDYPSSDEHYDGVWGISDHYLLTEAVNQFSNYPAPFFSTIFTLSSHHPYTIPEKYQNRFPKGTLPIHESIGYADESLREFFAAAQKTDWYSNTLFVLTADHTSLSDNPEFQTKTGSLRIPIILFHPTDSLLTGIQKQVVQQIDIMPTVLDLVGYEKPYFSLGVNAFDKNSEHVAIAFKHDQYQLQRENVLICFDGEKTNFVHDVAADPMLRTNLVEEPEMDFSEQEAFLKGYLQTYSTALRQNKMTYETWTSQMR